MSITWGGLRFTDSMQFMESSLEKLSSFISTKDKKHTEQYLIELNKRFDKPFTPEEIKDIIEKR